MKKRMFAVCFTAVLLLAGCGGKNVSNSGAQGAPAASAPSVEENYWDMDMGMGGGDDFLLDEPLAGSSIYQDANAKLIRRADLSIQTEQFDESAEALNRLAASCGGYFENASVYGGSRRDVNASRWGEYTVRIPAENYDRFLSSTGDLGYVVSKDESSENIGERYYDTEARLKTQRTKQERLLALLERAESMEDIIALESALTEVEYQIEQYSSDLNRYDALVGFSTVQIHLSEVSRVDQEVGETASLGQRMAAGFQASLRNLGESCQNFLIWVSYNIFLLVILAGAAAVVFAAGRHALKKRKRKVEPDGPEKD